MRTKEILATVAITGAVATFALLNVNSVQTGKTFLATPLTDAEREFITFVSEHRRSYGTKEEYENRLSLFTQAYEKVKNHDESSGTVFAINKFADMSSYEYKQMLGYKKNLRQGKRMTTFNLAATAADSVDWFTAGKVQGPKDQGQCGSCWAFTTAATMEAAHAIKSNTTPERLSV